MPPSRVRIPPSPLPFFTLGRVAAPINVWDYERLAEEKLDANAHAYFAGGAGDEVTLRDNVAAFERRKLRPRVLVDVREVSTAAAGTIRCLSSAATCAPAELTEGHRWFQVYVGRPRSKAEAAIEEAVAS